MTLVARSLRRQFTAAMALAMALALLLSGTALAQTTADEVEAVPIDDSCNDVPDDNFTDVSESNAFDDEIECLKAYNITKGVGDGSRYAPNKSVPRWQMALFIYRLAKIADEQRDEFELPTPDGDTPFTDLDGFPDDEAVNAIDALNEMGVVEGVTDTTYEPYTMIKRDQMASFINRLQGYIQGELGGDDGGFPPGPDEFPDVDDSNVHFDNINALAAVGIVQGKVTGDYDPRGQVSRGQMSAFMMRHVEVNVNNGVLTSLYPGVEDGVGGVVTDDSLTGSDQYRYLPDGETDDVLVDYDDDDNFTVDGAEATMAAFEAAIDNGDRIGYADDESDDDIDTHNLVNADEATDGVIGNINTGGAPASYDIIEPNTGAVLTDYEYDSTTSIVTDNQYTTDGTAVGPAAFEEDLNEGDTVEVTTDEEGIRTHALTNVNVSGMVDSVSTAAPGTPPALFTIDELGDNPATAQDADFTSDGGASFKVDGETATEADFEADVSVGDQATFARDNDVVSITLVNEMPKSQAGEYSSAETATAPDGAAGGETLTLVDEDGPFDVTYPGTGAGDLDDPVFLVDGVVSTEAELEAELTAGDLVSVVEEDVPSDTSARVSLSNTSLSGSPAGFVDAATDTIDVLGQDDTTLLADNLDYTTSGEFDDDGTEAIVYVVDGDETDEAGFEAELVTASGDLDANLEVAPIESDGGDVIAVEYRLTTE